MRVKSLEDSWHTAEVKVIAGRDLDSALVRTWEEIQFSNPELANPYFSPEFTKIVASVRDDVRVAVILENNIPVAFFPFQQELKGVGGPVGGFVSDFQALICRPDFMCSPLELLQECGLTTYKFHQLLASQKNFAPFFVAYDPSPQVDLSKGYDSYTKEKRTDGSDLVRNCANLARRLEREIGPLRFVAHSADPALLRQALALKSNQYLRTGGHDFLDVEWLQTVIEKIHTTQTNNFAGTLSLLYAGDKLVATHVGMRSRTVWHYWFPAYDKEMAKYSPGLQLALRMAEYAASIGVHIIDLDKGRSLYKRRLMNKTIFVARGSVDRRFSRRITQRARRVWHWVHAYK